MWRSIFRHGYENTLRNRTLHIVGNVFLHLHPVRTPRSGIGFTYTWGLGGISFFLFILLTISGVLLMFYYVPDSNRAYDDTKDLDYVVPFGLFLRNLHRWAAHLMVITVWLHMLRVFLTGSYKPPREFNWGIGVMLLVLTLLLSFSGYLLPWDQIAFWAVTVGTNMATSTPVIGAEGPFSLVSYENDIRFMILGSRSVGQTALIRFYVLHCLAIPLLAAVFMAAHFWRVRKDTFSAPNDIDKDTGMPVRTFGSRTGCLEVWPHLVAREFLGALVVLLLLVGWSIWINAPLEEEADPNNTPNPAKAPWYFLGLQELLVYFDPWIAGVVLPGVIIVGLLLIPYLDPNPRGIGLYGFCHRPHTVSVFLFGFLLWIVLILIGQFVRGPGWAWYWPWEDWGVPKALDLTMWSLSVPIGLLCAGAYIAAGMYFPRKYLEVMRQLALWQYVTVQLLLLSLLAVPIKIILRLTLNLKYVLVTPWFSI